MNDGLCECGCGRQTERAAYTRRKLGHVRGEFVRFVHGHGTRKPRSASEPLMIDGQAVRRIPVWPGHFALVDEADVAAVDGLAWNLFKGRKTNYARCKIRVGTDQWLSVSIHRLIMNPPADVEIDHKNRNGLDCRRRNMRFATQSQNAANETVRSTNRTGYKGTHYRSDRKNYRMTIRDGNERIRMSGFTTAIEAAHAYDIEASRIFGEFAVLNFPES